MRQSGVGTSAKPRIVAGASSENSHISPKIDLSSCHTHTTDLQVECARKTSTIQSSLEAQDLQLIIQAEFFTILHNSLTMFMSH